MPIFSLPNSLNLLQPGIVPVCPRSRHWFRIVAIGLCFGFLFGLIVEACRTLFGSNAHEVLPGRVYRTSQLSPDSLKNFVRKHHIRTIVNLRGSCPSFDWYQGEANVAQSMNVSLEDITFSAIRLPARAELLRLIDVLDKSQYPLVIHCRQGADRTGLAAVVILLIHSNADLKTALKQCSIRYAHISALATYEMDRFFEMYSHWLEQTGQQHSPDHFRFWARNEYTPDPAPARLELVDPIVRCKRNKAVNLQLRATNLSHSG